MSDDRIGYEEWMRRWGEAPLSHGERIKAWREFIGIGPDMLAAAASVPLTTILSIEHGDKTPSIEIAMRIAEALGMSLSDLLTKNPE